MTILSGKVCVVVVGAVVAGVSISSSAPLAAQAAPAAQPTPRAADGPPLVPVSLERDGNFRIAPPYSIDPAFIEKPGVPKGRVVRFIMNSTESRIYPTAPPGRGGGAGGGANAGAQQGAAPAQPPAPPPPPPQPQPFERIVAVYIPAGYVPNTPAPFMVVQDERWYIREDAPVAGTPPAPRTDLAFMPTMLDNLIYEKRIPPMVAVLLWPGPGPQRSIEYDVVSD